MACGEKKKKIDKGMTTEKALKMAKKNGAKSVHKMKKGNKT